MFSSHFFFFFFFFFSRHALTHQIVIAGVINGHVAAKYIYVRIFRNTNHMGKRSVLSIGSWVGIVILLWVIGWIIAEAIPVFNNLLSLIVALFASWFTCKPSHPPALRLANEWTLTLTKQTA